MATAAAAAVERTDPITISVVQTIFCTSRPGQMLVAVDRKFTPACTKAAATAVKSTPTETTYVAEDK